MLGSNLEIVEGPRVNVIWKRPDGFHGATPDDFIAVKVGGHSSLWLHKEDKKSFPFRISGGWEEEDASGKLNGLINLLACDKDEWLKHLRESYHHSLKDDPQQYMQETREWLTELQNHLKGDSWEVEIMQQAFSTIVSHLDKLEPEFNKQSQ